MYSLSWLITSKLVTRKTDVFFLDDSNTCVDADGVETRFDRPLYIRAVNDIMPYSLISTTHTRILAYTITSGSNAQYFYDIYLHPPEDFNSNCQLGTPDLSGSGHFTRYSSNRYGYFFYIGTALRDAINTSQWNSVREFVIAIRPRDAQAASLITTGKFYFQTHSIPSKVWFSQGKRFFYQCDQWSSSLFITFQSGPLSRYRMSC